MRIVKTVIAFSAVFLLFHILGSIVFPTDDAGVLQTPLWYPIAGIIISSVPAYFVYNQKKRYKERDFWINSDRDLAAKAVIKSGEASVSPIQGQTGWDYKRAARALSQLEKIGIIGPDNGTDCREILIDTSKKKRS